MSELTHFDESGRSRMVDVSPKQETEREATTTATVSMKQETFQRIMNNEIKKGDVLGVAQIAGIMAAKKTDSLVPMCHPLNITAVSMEFFPHEETSQIEVRATVKIVSRTGIEMEALVAVSVACLTIYDMCKAIDREMSISDIKLLKKSGGKSGTFIRDE
ncbi:MAG: cyclic pyranopterin monophosphate synthase MoaC [Deltaproteobacteria bacterium]|nr:cyclic pyranopterin monophosphate synthase MoaC [Deltaproteobacteria bacterium]